MILRPYQQAALDAIRANYRMGVHRQVIVAATGTGKSAILSRIPALMRADLPGQMLVIVHTTELVQQNAEALRQANPDLKVSIEMADLHADPNSDVVMASVQTLGRANTSRLGKFNWDGFSVCVADECFPAGTLIDGRPIETITVGDVKTLLLQNACSQTVVRDVVNILRAQFETEKGTGGDQTVYFRRELDIENVAVSGDEDESF
jgi:hypothetical protein